MTANFDPIRDVRFRGKALPDLTHAEMLEALTQALRQVRHLEETRPPGAWPSTIPATGPITPRPFPPSFPFSIV